jgi:hypothetical protein
VFVCVFVSADRPYLFIFYFVLNLNCHWLDDYIPFVCVHYIHIFHCLVFDQDIRLVRRCSSHVHAQQWSCLLWTD